MTLYFLQTPPTLNIYLILSTPPKVKYSLLLTNFLTCNDIHFPDIQILPDDIPLSTCHFLDTCPHSSYPQNFQQWIMMNLNWIISSPKPCNTDDSIIDPTTTKIWIHLPFLGKYWTKFLLLTNSFIRKISQNYCQLGKLLMLIASFHLKIQLRKRIKVLLFMNSNVLDVTLTV